MNQDVDQDIVPLAHLYQETIERLEIHPIELLGVRSRGLKGYVLAIFIKDEPVCAYLGTSRVNLREWSRIDSIVRYIMSNFDIDIPIDLILLSKDEK
jgi:hypothetical protein